MFIIKYMLYIIQFLIRILYPKGEKYSIFLFFTTFCIIQMNIIFNRIFYDYKMIDKKKSNVYTTLK